LNRAAAGRLPPPRAASAAGEPRYAFQRCPRRALQRTATGVKTGQLKDDTPRPYGRYRVMAALLRDASGTARAQEPGPSSRAAEQLQPHHQREPAPSADSTASAGLAYRTRSPRPGPAVPGRPAFRHRRLSPDLPELITRATSPGQPGRLPVPRTFSANPRSEQLDLPWAATTPSRTAAPLR
jgi:hypothetical protein